MATAENTPHPDAELLRTWDDFMALWRARKTDTEKDDDAFDDEAYRLEQVITWLPARTPAGLAVKLRLLFFAYQERLVEQNFLLHGGERPDSWLGDYRERLCWNAKQDAERLAGVAAGVAAHGFDPPLV
jgi:hypothetical protein